MESLRGKLLIASPALVDPNFARTVVLVAAHDEEGAIGVVLNRPSPLTVGETVPELVAVAGADAAVHVGGPVRESALVVLAEFADPSAAAGLVVADVGLVAADAETEALPDAVRRARVYAGHAGWGPGQLESELEQEAWFVEPPLPGELFPVDPEQLWSDVLTRKGGRYALVARMPPDPSVN